MTTPPLDVPARFAPRPKIDPRWARLLWPLLALLSLLAFDFLFIQDFFHVEAKDGRLIGSVIDILERASPLLLVAIGMTLVIATGGVDLSVGSIMAVSAAVGAKMVVAGAPAPLAFAAAIGVSVLCGAWNGALVSLLGIQPIVATLILMVAGRGIAYEVTDSQNVPFNNAAYLYLGSGYLFGLPVAITVAAIALLLTALLVRKTALGLFIEAVGGNATASRYAGVNPTGVTWMVYVFSAACAGLAGLIAAGDIGRADPNDIGKNRELDAILAVVIGGTALTGGRFSLPGSLLGALVIQTLTTTILTFGISHDRTLVVKALVVIVVCLLQSEGLRERVARWRRRN